MDSNYIPQTTQVDYTYPSEDCYPHQYDGASGGWQFYYSYANPEYTPAYPDPHVHAADVRYHQPMPSADLPLHAPVPISTYTSLLTDDTSESTSTSSYHTPQDFSSPDEDTKPLPVEHENPLDVYLDAPQELFPTPSELLTDLNSREPERSGQSGTERAEKTSTKTPRSLSGRAKRSEAREKPESLNQRKAYFRSVSANVGFTITDPDTITSHDKKRSYLECLEEYVQWLHEQIHLVGHKPLPLERISTYRGLKNRSLRTILVHNQNILQKLNMQKLEAEEKFMELQNAVLMRQAAEESLQLRRHSIAMGAMPHGVVPNFSS